MSTTRIRPYVKARCEALGYREHHEAFSRENIGKNQGKRFFVLIGNSAGVDIDNAMLTFDIPVEVQLLLGSARDTQELQERAFEAAEECIADLCSPGSQAQAQVKLLPDSLAVEPIDETNDNCVIARLGFQAKVKIGF